MRKERSLCTAMARVNVRRNASDEVSLQKLMSNLLLQCIFTGRGRIWSIDGNWKIRYPVCMYPVPKNTAAFEGNPRYVDTCPNSPAYGKAFCEDHCLVASAQSIPVDLRGFLSYKGI